MRLTHLTHGALRRCAMHAVSASVSSRSSTRARSVIKQGSLNGLSRFVFPEVHGLEFREILIERFCRNEFEKLLAVVDWDGTCLLHQTLCAVIAKLARAADGFGRHDAV